MRSKTAKKLLIEAKAEQPPTRLLHRYEVYLTCCDDGTGFEIEDSDNPSKYVAALKTFDQWLDT